MQSSEETTTGTNDVKKMGGPKVRITLPEAIVKKTLAMSTSSAELLSCYASFLSAYHGAQITGDLIVEGLIQGLASDRAFKAWMKARAQQQ